MIDEQEEQSMIDVRGDGLVFPAYRSYLVRFWQSNEQGCWRASAQCVQTGNTVLFGSVERLMAFLQTEIQVSPTPGEAGQSTMPAEPG